MRLFASVVATAILGCFPGWAQPVPASSAPEPPDIERGAELWAKCRACHTLEPDGRNIVGPRLHGIFGRRAGSQPDYRYSEAMKTSGLVWTEQTLDAYLAATQDFLPGTKMYGGLAIPQDRADLIAWLKQQAGNSR